MNSRWKSKKIQILASTSILLVGILALLCWKFIYSSPLKVYWFIPDGLRAEPVVFKLYEWANQGKLPHIKKMMEQGTYAYSKPSYPGHTPTNFATLFTGKEPHEHGVADGPMHLEGFPLAKVSVSGFSSHAKTAPAIWNILENEQKLDVTLVALPGSTPPELQRGTVVKGRWGGWGVEFPATIFHSAKDLDLQRRQGPGNRLFGFGQELTVFSPPVLAEGWTLPPNDQNRIDQGSSFEVEINQWGHKLFALLVQGAEPKVIFSRDKKVVLAELKIGEWSEWIPASLIWNRKVLGDNGVERSEAVAIDSSLRLHVIRMTSENDFRIRIVYNGLNKYLVSPAENYLAIENNVGPMVDYPDSFPPQLIFYQEDKQAFLAESRQSFEWHRKMVEHAIHQLKSEVVIHDIYTPNQMLTSRWWMGYLDPDSILYSSISENERQQLWDEVLEMYQSIDRMIGEMMKHGNRDSYYILSSDHGAIPLNYEVRLNNLFAEKGWLKYTMDRRTGSYVIDWKNTKVVFLKMNAIYINPQGLDGPWKRASGDQYEKLRQEVSASLKALEGPNGVYPLAKIATWENADQFGLPKERVGDLIISNVAGYGWTEDIDYQGRIFHQSSKTGYKQAVNPEIKGMWTPFIIMGPKIKKNRYLPRLIDHREQFDVILNLVQKEKKKTTLWEEIWDD